MFNMLFWLLQHQRIQHIRILLAEINKECTFPVYRSVTTLVDCIYPIWEKNSLMDSAVDWYESPPRNRVGVSIFAGVSFPKFLFPPWDLSPRAYLPRACSTLIYLPKCSIPLNSKDLFKADFLENFTKAIPFDFPSGLINRFTFKISPHYSNNCLMSES